MTAHAHVVFQIGAAQLALPLEAVIEVLPLPRLAQPPARPPVLEGFLDLGGMLLSVLRLDCLLGLPSQPTGLYAHILRLRLDGAPVALLVERVVGIVAGGGEEARPVAGDQTFRGCVVAEFEHRGSPVHVLAAERLLSEHERSRIEAYRTAEAERRQAFEVAQ